MQNFRDWMMFYTNSNSNWGVVADAVKNNADMFITNDKDEIRAAIYKLGLGEDFNTIWSGYLRYQTKMYKQITKVSKTVLLPEDMVKQVQHYKIDNNLSSFGHAVYIILQNGMKE